MQCATYCSTKQLKKNSQEPQSSTVMPPKLGWGMAKLLQVTRPTAMYNCMSHPKKELGKQGVPKELRWQEGSHLLLQGAVLGCLPDGKAKGDLIDEICQVVNEVQDVVINCTHEVTKKVAQGIDGPASSDNQTHGAEGLLHVLVHRSLTSSFAIPQPNFVGMTVMLCSPDYFEFWSSKMLHTALKVTRASCSVCSI